jgi:hypothetical protein
VRGARIIKGMRDVTGTFTVFVDGRQWKSLPSLQSAGAQEEVFALDRATGQVRFGDGVHGRRPPDNAAVTINYRTGSGGSAEVSVSLPWPPPADLRVMATTSPQGVGILQLSASAERFHLPAEPIFYAGQLLTSDDLRAEQEYNRHSRLRHNRALHGVGVASGLDIRIDSDAGGSSVVVAPGVAVDRMGRELELCEPVHLAVPEDHSSHYVTVVYTSRDGAAVPTAEGGLQPTRRRDGAIVCLSAAAPPDGVVIGLIVRESSGWQVRERPTE